MNTGTVIGSSVGGWRIDRGLFQLGIAFLLLPGYFLLGAEFKFLMIPYVLFLLFSRKAAYFPALLVHFLPGSLVSQVILAGCAVLPLVKWRRLGRYRIKMLYWVSFLPLLILGYIAGQKFFFLGYSWVDVANDLAIYLGLFGFFYGVLIADQVNRTVIERVFWVLLISVFIQTSGLVEGTIRYIFLGIPLLTTVAISSLLITRRIDISLTTLVPLLLSMPLILRNINTFTIVLSTIIAILLVFAHTHWKILVRRLPVGKVLGGLAILLTVYVVSTTDEMAVGGQGRNAADIETWGDILPTLEYKAFGDRGTVWVGAWNILVRENNIWPPDQPPQLGYEVGQKTMEVTFGAHNIGLELLRQYGFVVGFAGIGVYLAIMGYIGRTFVSRTANRLMLIVGAVVLAVFFTGLVGHYVLINNFSFLLTGLAGIVYGYSSKPSLHKNVLRESHPSLN